MGNLPVTAKICVVAGFFLLAAGCQQAVHPVAGEGSLGEIVKVEDHSEVLVEWLKAGFRDRIVVAVDVHDDLRQIPADKIAELKRLAGAGDWEAISTRRDRGAESLYMLGDYLFAAHRLGVLRRLYWVVPPQILTETELANGGRTLLRAYGYPEKMAEGFRREGDAVRGSLFGVDVTISTVKGLPRIQEPVLLTVDGDYFALDLKRTGNRGLTSLRELCMGLQTRRLSVAHASVAYSVHGNYAAVTDRHHADEMAEVLANPQRLRGEFPGLWTMRDWAFSFLRQGRFVQAEEAFAAALRAFPGEASLEVGQAVSLALAGRDSEAQFFLTRAARKAPYYDYTYIHIGKELEKKREIGRSRAYIEQYLSLHPGSFHGLMAYGDLLYNIGNFDEALDAYHSVLNQYLEVNAVMYAGDAFMRVGRFPEARMYYEKGKELLDGAGHRSLDDFPQSARYMKLLSIYLAKG